MKKGLSSMCVIIIIIIVIIIIFHYIALYAQNTHLESPFSTFL